MSGFIRRLWWFGYFLYYPCRVSSHVFLRPMSHTQVVQLCCATKIETVRILRQFLAPSLNCDWSIVCLHVNCWFCCKMRTYNLLYILFNVIYFHYSGHYEERPIISQPHCGRCRRAGTVQATGCYWQQAELMSYALKWCKPNNDDDEILMMMTIRHEY